MMTTNKMPANSEKKLKELAVTYGFKEIVQSSRMKEDCKIKEDVLAKTEKALESLSSILSIAMATPIENARVFCGLSGSLTLSFKSPEELWGQNAMFSPENQMISLLDREYNGTPACSQYGHEWAHALDFVLGLKKQQEELGPLRKINGLGSPMKALKDAAESSPAPYHSAMGTFAKMLSNGQKNDEVYASIKASQYGKTIKLPGFMSLINLMIPKEVEKMAKGDKNTRMNESTLQADKIFDFVEESAYQCFKTSVEIKNRSLPEKQLKFLARFCAVSVMTQSQKESSQRRGREKTMDLIKKEIATMIGNALRINEKTAYKIASSVMHISGIKEQIGDPTFSAPYSGRSTWPSPGSLADMSCAMVRVCRNQRALSNSKLAKERFVPMAFWWSMRRHVSVNSDLIGKKTHQAIQDLASAGMLPKGLAQHSSDWRKERGDYKAGALVFSDLVATGSKLIQQESTLIGTKINEKEARGLRKKITTPINEMAQRKTVIESFAESFEQFVIAQSSSRTRLGKACQAAVKAHLVDVDEEERQAAIDPSISWLNNKDGDIASVVKYWKKLLRELGELEYFSDFNNKKTNAQQNRVV